MKKLTAIFLGLMLVTMYAVPPSTFADEGQTGISAEKAQQLEDKVDSLERLVKSMEGHISSAEGTHAVNPVTPSTGEQPGGLIHTAQDIHMGGYLDVEFNQNLSANSTNIPGAANSGGNPFRAFDLNQNTFSLNAANLEFEKQANPEGGVGFRFDVATGENAQVIDALTAGTDGDEFSIQQLYAQLVAPLSFFKDSEIFGDTIDIRAGRFVTLAGFEVIRSPDNWNISRGLLFTLAEPATHTGLRAIWKMFSDKVTTYWGLNNGWDNEIDNNQMKTVETGFTWSPIESVTWSSALYWGPENARQGGHRRFLLTNVANWKVTDKLNIVGQIDFGSQGRVVALEGQGFENARWHGYSAYAHYQFNPKWAGTYRAELFRDDTTLRTTASNTGDDDETMFSQTVTVERILYDSLITRLEYRWDHSNDHDLFNQEASQQTLGAQVIYQFA